MPIVYVGMSGGIDSTAAAYLLQKEGFDVRGVTFVAMNEEGSKKCCSLEEINAARSICASLGISHQTVDVRDVFQTRIIQYFIDSYKQGLTPNPCVLCNRFVKFGALLEYSLSEGADYFATGHYARIARQDDGLFIRRGADQTKDQSYFLSNIEKEKLPFIKLPLGAYQKTEVREIVEEASLPINPHKEESQDICFIKGDYREFLLAKGVQEKEGEFFYQGRKIGRHHGIPFYSLGQRRGLGVSVGERAFVRSMDSRKNQIVLGDKPFSDRLTVHRLNFFTDHFEPGRYDVQIRYQSKVIPADVILDGDFLVIKLSKPQEIVTPGQFAVVYRDELVYASGEIFEAPLI